MPADRIDRNQYRLSLIALRNNAGVPQADRNSLNNWITANVDLPGGDWLTVTLSASGNNPWTHAGCCGVVSEWQFRKLTRRLLNLANVTPPDGYDDYKRRQKRAWLVSQAAAVKAAIGVVYALDDVNDGRAGFEALLAREGLQRTP